ncbi:hypothetical protein PAMP_004928 [Pampus punctatissimus]
MLGHGNPPASFSLNPPYFNLAEGSRISATATCGQDEAGRARYELYCKLVGGPTTGLATQNIQGQFCDYCNSDDPNKAYPATNAIDGTERWWQSPPLSRGINYNEVNVTLDFGQRQVPESSGMLCFGALGGKGNVALCLESEMGLHASQHVSGHPFYPRPTHLPLLPGSSLNVVTARLN